MSEQREKSAVTVLLCAEAVTYVSLVASFLSVWLTVCAALDRVAVLHRGGRTSFSSCTRARFVTVGLLWFALPVYLNISILIDVAETYVGPLCTVLHDYYDMMQVSILTFLFIHETAEENVNKRTDTAGKQTDRLLEGQTNIYIVRVLLEKNSYRTLI